jgi:hypothetical protein
MIQIIVAGGPCFLALLVHASPQDEIGEVVGLADVLRKLLVSYRSLNDDIN